MSLSGSSLRRSLTALSAPVVLLAACQRGDAGGGAKSSESGGDVTKSWNPPAVAAAGAVPATEIRSAIVSRLGKDRPTGINDDHWHHVQALYKHYNQSALWTDANGLISSRVKALTGAMLTADDHDALDLSEYPFDALAKAMKSVADAGGKATAAQIADADVLLTASYAALGEDLLSGQVNPREMKQDWHIDPRDEAIDSALARGLVTDSLDASLEALHPQDPGYEALRKELAHYRELAAHGGWSDVPAGRALTPGQRDTPARIEALRARLAAEGYDVGGGPAVPPPATDSAAPGTPNAPNAPNAPARSRAPSTGGGVYSRALAGAVAQFQSHHAIDVDSVLGAGTVQAMNRPATYRLAQIAANMERYRWMPRSLGSRYIYVNVPAFQLVAYDSGQKALEMKVVVGQEYEGKKTPVFADSMETVVFRPYWNVTDDIAKSEIWPKVNADPGYLEASNMETYRDGGVTRIRQRPGEKNSLGYVKFLFPNEYNIYLHDTPAKALFQKDIRAFSHGCIRLEKPAELAQWVLGWPADKVDAAMQSGPDNRSVRLPRKIPVYIAYFTAYVDDAQLHFGNDLYDRDDALVAAAGKAAVPNPAVQQAVAALRQMAG